MMGKDRLKVFRLINNNHVNEKNSRKLSFSKRSKPAKIESNRTCLRRLN